MSQTETILLIVLGFSLASLIALFMGRMVWTTAMKLGAKRMQTQLPSTLVGLQTERNRLRAEYAMMTQRLGARLEEAKLKAAEQMAEVSRHRNRLHQIENGETTRSAELRQLRAQLKNMETALSESVVREQDLRNRLAETERSLQKLRRGKKDSKQDEAGVPPAQSATSPPSDPEVRLRQRIDKLAELARAGRHQPQDQEPPPPPSMSTESAIAEKLAEAERRTAELEEQLRKLDAEWASKTSAATAAEGSQTPDVAEDNVISLSTRIHNLKKSLGTSQ